MKKIIALFLCMFALCSCSSCEVAQSITHEDKSQQGSAQQVISPETNPEQTGVSTDPQQPESPSSDTNEETALVPAPTVNTTVYGLNGEVMFSANSEHYEGLTVLDALLETAKEKNIAAVYAGSKTTAYVTSINGLSEKQHGPMSGWIFTVNGESVMKSSGKLTLNPGDEVVWKYITES